MKNNTEVPQVSKEETEIILELVDKCLSFDGDIVEFGCYKGDTSLLISRLLKNRRSDKRFWIYDSFAGLPPKSTEDQSVAGEQFQEGSLFVSKKQVINRFKQAGLKIPIVKKGFFEELNESVDVPEKICFGFLDGDLYQSIKTSLKLCDGKVVPGGIIIVHDYNNPELPGVAKAVDEYKKARLNVIKSLAILQF